MMTTKLQQAINNEVKNGYHHEPLVISSGIITDNKSSKLQKLLTRFRGFGYEVTFVVGARMQYKTQGQQFAIIFKP